MLKLGTETKLKPAEVVEKAVQFFGGHGLKVTNQTDTSVCFEGSGGGVEIAACAGEKGTSVDVVSREWDSQAKDFMARIK